jgi:hypothetical protein
VEAGEAAAGEGRLPDGGLRRVVPAREPRHTRQRRRASQGRGEGQQLQERQQQEVGDLHGAGAGGD